MFRSILTALAVVLVVAFLGGCFFREDRDRDRDFDNRREYHEREHQERDVRLQVAPVGQHLFVIEVGQGASEAPNQAHTAP